MISAVWCQNLAPNRVERWFLYARVELEAPATWLVHQEKASSIIRREISNRDLLAIARMVGPLLRNPDCPGRSARWPGWDRLH